MIDEAYFGQFNEWSDASVRRNFGINWLYTAVLMHSKALNYIIIDLEWKWDSSAPIQALGINVTWYTIGKYWLIWAHLEEGQLGA